PLRTFHIGGTAARIAEQTVRKTKVEGVIEFGDRLIFVETPEKQRIVTSYEGELVLKAPAHGEGGGGKLSVHSRFHVPLGATLMVVDGAKVARDSVLFTTIDRKSTRLNSSHVAISYAVFCLKKKKRSKSAKDGCL